jgi:hypothetical protein
VLGHLQHEQARDQGDGGKPHDHRAHHGTLVEKALFAPVILDAHGWHGSCVRTS